MFRCTLLLSLLALPLLAGARPATAPASTDDMVLIKGGAFAMGTDDGYPFEGPVHEVALDAFWMDKHEVTVAQFEKFVQASGYKTDADKFGWSGVFDMKTNQWGKCDGANWRHPAGPTSNAKPSDPVVHVSLADAQAYAKWAGKRLPTEAEFEYAERGGLVKKKFAWGDELYPDGKPRANIWQGTFPDKDEAKDGHAGIAPVMSYPPNGYGLHDMTGNVWEWCSDWFADDYYKNSPKQNPKGPDKGEEKILRGGSWMCSENYCLGYRNAARNKTAPDSGLDNLGFRCVKDAR